MERKLAAIFSTDAKGYSRLMGDDEEATIHTLKTYRAVITNLIEHHHGRVVDSPGDNMLAEFASAVDAVKAAVAIQAELKTRNNELEVHRQMEFRIGLNVGDVITDEGRLYGDGVNIAARLEALADPGGICVSESVHMQVRNKLSFQYAYIGEREVKNIATPVPVYKVQLESDGTAAPTVNRERFAPTQVKEQRPSRRWPMAALAVVAVLAVGAGVLVFRAVSPQLSAPSETESAEAPPLPLPDKPSLAVLPFTNMSGDPAQEYFSDGMTDTLITDLSQLSGLFVIARNSVFTYKEQPVKVEQVGQELGVRYVLEGSVQRAANQVRINTQLIDATTGGHVWAERYDRELQDLFVLQDDLARKIVLALKVALTPEEQIRFQRFPTKNLDAYDDFLRASEFFNRFSKDTALQARQLFERAIERDPKYAAAYASLGYLYWSAKSSGWDLDPQNFVKAAELARKALALDASSPLSYMLLGELALWQDHQHKQAVAALDKAVTLDPNFANAYFERGHILTYAGEPERAIASIQTGMRLDPHYSPACAWMLGRAYTLTGRYTEALPIMQRVVALSPDLIPAYADLAIIYTRLGQPLKAQAAAAAIMRLNPVTSLEGWKQAVPFKEPVVLNTFLNDLRKAGLK